MIASIARLLATPGKQGNAISLAMAGTPIALALGVPVGTFGGDLAGWRATFAAMSVLALLLLAWIRLVLPDLPGDPAAGGGSLRAIATRPGVPAIMAVIVAWMFGRNVLYTSVASFAAGAGLGGRVDLVLLLFGLAALLVLWITGRLVDRSLRACTLLSLMVFATTGVVLFTFAHAAVVVLVAVSVWGLTFGGASPLLNTAAADAAGEDAELVLAMVTTVWNVAIAAGGLAGGLLLGAFGPVSLPLALALSALTALAIVGRSDRHGFPR